MTARELSHKLFKLDLDAEVRVSFTDKDGVWRSYPVSEVHLLEKEIIIETRKEVKKVEIINKIVDFEAYCPKCQNRATAEEENPCYECLQSPVNIHTKEPVFFKEGKPIVKKDLRRKAR